jgi:hypothetical protein
VRYFNRLEIQAGRLKGRVNPNFDQDIAWYLKRFSHAKPGQLRGEISPVYLSDEEAPAAIKARYPNAKLLVCLRNPVDQAFSFYKLHRGNRIIADMSFEEALEREDVYLRNAMYGEQVARYLQHFDRNQFLVVVFEELIAEPVEQFGRIFRFLGVEPPADLEPSKYHTNESAKRRSDKIHKAAFKVSQWLIDHGFNKVLGLLRAIGVHNLVNRVNAAPFKRESLKAETRERLKIAFRDDIVRLEHLLGVDVGRWK